MLRILSSSLVFVFLAISCTSNIGGSRHDKIESTKKNKWNVYAVANRDELPDCDKETDGNLYHVEGDNSFETCESGNWRLINIKGDIGDQGNQGSQGDRGFTGNQGNKGDIGSQGDIGVQGIKGNKGDQGSVGSVGPKGDKGDNGNKGDRGDPGPQGPAGVGNIVVRDNSGNKIGHLIGNDKVVFSDGKFGVLILKKGVFYGAPTLNTLTHGLDRVEGCFFTTLDCTGTCYLYINAQTTPLKNSVVNTSDGMKVVTGDEETLGPGIAIRSHNSNPTPNCVAINIVTQDLTYPVDTPYSHPEGVSYPFETPLQFGN